ncbi:hypothetical protein EDB81DRAFT_789567 [Dactylonectria macrodidyma]|uniref:BZIP domain-containing protein n=1 Tax=Dactylonectria macrodidyma TaxID=307937 RepID=A0A9P9F5L9_9HYPO|nr:hypothetical protein EDB81DRAFT_789567 [Dactylonectria macrodidyma]
MGNRVVPVTTATLGHGKAQGHDEAWAGVTDANLRRRLQNRLNQRESRRRRAAERAAATGTAKALNEPAHTNLRPVAPKPIVSKPWDDGTPSWDVSSEDNLASGSLIPGDFGNDGYPNLADGMLGSEFADSIRTQSVGALSRYPARVHRCPDVNILPGPISCVADAQRIWHYALTIVLPTLGVKTQEGEPLHVALFRSATLEQAVFYAVLVGGSTQRLTQTQSREDARVLMIAQNKTAEAVRESLARGMVTEGILFAIMTLALKRNDGSSSIPVAQRYRGGFSSPVRNVGGLNWVGQLQFAPDHTSMAIQLLRDRQTRGNSLPGLLDYFQLSELYRASLNLTRPGVDLRPHTNMPPDGDTIAQFGLWEPDSFIVHDALKQVVADMRVCCLLIKQMSNMDADVNHFIRLRNEMQYRLLCISDDQNKAELLAIMIFSYGVIFPISDPWPLGQLTKKLYFEILAETAFDEARAQLLLWASVIGGIASWGGEFQGGYTLLVAKHANTLGVQGWDEVVEILDKFLWLDTACSAGGQLVWGNALVYLETTV